MGYRLGVDLGTTFTAAAANGRGGSPVVVGLGNRALQVPSVLYLQANGDFLVGEAAERRWAGDPARVVREFKRRLGDPVPLLVAGTPYSAQSLMARLLSWVVATATERLGAAPDEIVLTYPANWGSYKRELLDQVIQLADVGPVVTCPEPQAAAIQYAARAELDPGDRILVYDLGGGTFDVCVVEQTSAGFTIRGTPEGIEHLGGVDFDEAVFQHVLAALGPMVEFVDPDSAEGRSALARLRQSCVEAKEALSSDVDVTIPVTLAGRGTTVRMTRSELEALIAPALEQTVAAVGRALRGADTAPQRLKAIVLVGGSSRIPLVSQLLQSRFGTRTAVDIHPKHDIAAGASRYEAARPTAVLPVVEPVLTDEAPKRSSWAAVLASKTGRAVGLAAAALAIAAVAVAVVLNQLGHRDSLGGVSAPPASESPTPTGPGLYGLAVAPDSETVYVSNLSAGTVSAIDVATGRERTAAVGPQPLGLARVGGYVYAVNYGAGTVSKLNQRTLEPSALITVGRHPQSIVVDPSTFKGYVTNRDDDTVAVIDLDSGRRLKSIGVGRKPLNLVLDPDASRLYVVSVESGRVDVINTATRRTSGEPISVPDRPHAIALDTAAGRLYLTHENSRRITVIDTDAREIRPPITLDAVPTELAVADGLLYATLKDTDRVAVIQTGTGKVRAPIATGDEPVALAVSADEQRLYITNNRSKTVSVVDTITNRVVGRPLIVP